MTFQLTIEGMTCSGCAARVEKAIRSLPGTSSVNIDLTNGKATVVHDGAKSTQEQIRKAITAAGYKAHL
jgi:copper chaperone CopZ